MKLYYIISIIIGSNLHHIQSLINMSSLQHGVDYYAEIHKTFLNSVVHSIFMPIAMFGMFLWIPVVFNLCPFDAHRLRKYVCIVYLTHYSYINIYISFLVFLYYYNSYYYANIFYKKYSYIFSFYVGLCTSVASLSIQEIFGHYLSGDEQSRFEAIPNAVIYAPYFSVAHFFYK